MSAEDVKEFRLGELFFGSGGSKNTDEYVKVIEEAIFKITMQNEEW